MKLKFIEHIEQAIAKTIDDASVAVQDKNVKQHSESWLHLHMKANISLIESYQVIQNTSLEMGQVFMIAELVPLSDAQKLAASTVQMCKELI